MRKRVIRLPVIPANDNAPVWMPKPGLPAGGRAECRHGERPCPYVRCQYHLWLIEGRDRPGRHWYGKPPPTTLEPRWLEHPTPPCCALDVAESVAPGEVLTYEAIGRAMGYTLEWSRQLVFRAMAKLKGKPRP